MNIKGFSQGDGVLVEGTNVMVIDNNIFTGNKNGVELITTSCSPASVCAPGTHGAGYKGYAANAIHSRNNHYFGNYGWGLLLDQTTRGGGTGLGNESDGDTYEQNGAGAISTESENGFSVHNGYFETNPHFIVCGTAAGSCYGPTLFANHFTANAGGFDIELVSSHGASVWGNSEFGAGGKWSRCMINLTRGSSDHNWIGNNYSTGPAEPIVCTNGMRGLAAGDTSYVYGATMGR